MGQLLKQSTAYNIPFFMIDATDSITGKTGLSPTVTLSKNGAAFGAAGGSVTEIGNGWYYLAANTTDTGTLASLLLHATATGADPWDEAHQVLVDIPGGSISSVTGSVGSVTGNVGGNVVGSVGSVVATVSANLTQILGTALTETAGQLAAGFKKFFNVGSPTSTMNEITLVDTTTTLTNAVSSVTGSVGSVTGAVGSVIGNVGGNVVGSVGSVTGLTVANLDTTVSSRLSTAHFDTIIGTPENATVSADIAEIDEDVDDLTTVLISPALTRVITYPPPKKC